MDLSTDQQASRIVSIDLLRGAVMVLMAIDHVRVFAGIPAGGPTFGIFFTRWITHFCAPAFLFLAGTSAFFYGRTHANLSQFLLSRGVWLVFLELTFLRVAWTFNFDFAQYEMAGVIWVIGWCMILMAGLVKLPLHTVAAFSVVIIACHNLLDSHIRTLIPTLHGDPVSAVWKILYVGFYAGPISFGEEGPNLIVLYSFVPWIGVMTAGYAFGKILTFEPVRRDKMCLTIGCGAIALFILLRSFNLYGDPRPWDSVAGGSSNSPPMPGLLAFLDTTKYPASFSFLLMTLGPSIALIPLLERARGGLAQRVALFGRVPFFFYMLHIPLIHALALVVSSIMMGHVSSWLFANHPMGNPPPPAGYTWSLWTLYAVWGVTIVILYHVCRWFAHIKSSRHEWWLKYV
jgi:uncharacterized membrane protein